MARKTKEEAAATREKILDVAVRIFSEQGLTHTSLQQIADGACLTRGAIQWHFSDKEGLVRILMMERVLQPARRALAELEAETSAAMDPLDRLKALVMVVLGPIAYRPQVRRIAELTMLRMDSFDRSDAAYRMKLDCMEAWARRAGKCVTQAQRSGLLPDTVDAGATGMIICAMLQGLIRSWLVDPAKFDLGVQGKEMTEVFLNGLRTVHIPLTLPAPARRDRISQ